MFCLLRLGSLSDSDGPLKTVPEDDNKENNYMVTIKHVYSYVLKVIQKVTALVFKDGFYKLWVV